MRDGKYTPYNHDKGHPTSQMIITGGFLPVARTHLLTNTGANRLENDKRNEEQANSIIQSICWNANIGGKSISLGIPYVSCR